MFDPHHTRYSNRRYYTRKGQVIQAKRIDAPLGIESRLVPMYKDYIVKNKLIKASDLPPQIPVLNSVYASIDQSTTEIEDMAQTIAPTAVSNCIGVAIGVDPSDSNFWIVYIFYVYYTSWNIPTGFSYKTWPVGYGVINQSFELRNEDNLGISFPIISAAPASTTTAVGIVLNHKINKDIIKFE